MRIRVIFPGRYPDFHTKEQLLSFLSPSVTIDIVHAEVGPETISSRLEEVLAIPGTLQQIGRAAKEGIDAVVIDCMGDPGVEQGRELVDIPVIGPSKVSMHIACTLGERFAVITMAEAVNPLVRQQARMYGLESRLAATLSIEIPPKDLQCDPAKTGEALYQQVLKAITVHQADTIIFGCCGMMGCKEQLVTLLSKKGIVLPIIDPLPLALKYAQMLVELNLSHSKRFYGSSKLQPFPGFEFLSD